MLRFSKRFEEIFKEKTFSNNEVTAALKF